MPTSEAGKANGDREKAVNVRVTMEERDRIVERALRHGLSLSEFARQALMTWTPPIDNQRVESLTEQVDALYRGFDDLRAELQKRMDIIERRLPPEEAVDIPF